MKSLSLLDGRTVLLATGKHKQGYEQENDELRVLCG